jgi:hypothetical protein
LIFTIAVSYLVERSRSLASSTSRLTMCTRGLGGLGGLDPEPSSDSWSEDAEEGVGDPQSRVQGMVTSYSTGYQRIRDSRVGVVCIGKRDGRKEGRKEDRYNRLIVVAKSSREQRPERLTSRDWTLLVALARPTWLSLVLNSRLSINRLSLAVASLPSSNAPINTRHPRLPDSGPSSSSL